MPGAVPVAVMVAVMVAVGTAIVTGARWAALGAPTGRGIAGGLLAVVVVATTVGAALDHRRPVVAAAVVLASSTTVLAAATDGRWQGAIAIVMLALAAWSDRREVVAAMALLAVVGSVLWWRSGFDRGAAPGPSWREVAGETGSVVRRAVSSVGTGELLVPLSGVIVWWLGVGLVVGAALAAGRLGRAALIGASLAVFIAGVWAIRLWRGSVDPIAGTWIVTTGIVLGSAYEPEPDDGAGAQEWRTATVVMGSAGLVMAIAFVHELRAESPLAAIAAGLGALVVGLSGGLLSARSGAGPGVPAEQP